MSDILINIENTMTEVQARRMAVHILEEEANQLACLAANREDYEKQYPHRATLAISREIARLRLIAKTLNP